MASLQESLNSFKKQQEKCQSAPKSKSIAGSKTIVKTATPANTSTKLSSPSFKFPNDTKRLQHINYNIRKSPIEAQIYRVIDLLFKVQTLSVLVSCMVIHHSRLVREIFCIFLFVHLVTVVFNSICLKNMHVM